MIDRMLFHIYSNDLFSDNQHGSTPQKGTVDAELEVKNFIEDSLRLKECAVIVSLDVRGVFDATWWPGILEQLRDVNSQEFIQFISKLL